jgi:hypothetical protein
MAIRQQIQTDQISRAVGYRRVFIATITAAANAGVTNVGTVTTNPIIIESAIIHANAAQTANMTSCGLFGGGSQVVTIISAATAVQAALDATDKQVSTGLDGNKGPWRLAATRTIDIDLQGTGATAVNLTIIITYYATVAGAFIA